MRWRKQQAGLWLFLLAYGFSVYWCFFRANPLFKPRPVTVTFAHWQIERGPPDGFAAVIKRYEEPAPPEQQNNLPDESTAHSRSRPLCVVCRGL